jgi:pyrophosphatase PpaX
VTRVDAPTSERARDRDGARARAMSARWPAVIFDLDGTLANTIPLIVASFNHALSTVVGTTVPEEEIRSWIGRPLVETFEAWPEHAVELDRIYREWNLANHDNMIEEYAGVPVLLADLASAGVAMGIVTSKRRETARAALAAVGIDGWLDVVAGLEDTTQHKPRPEPLLLGASRLGVEPSACVYVGDAVVDVQAARAAGMAAVGVTWGAGLADQLKAAEPDALLEDVDALRALLLA